MQINSLVSTKMRNQLLIQSPDLLLNEEMDTQAYTMFPFFLQTAEARPILLVLPGGGYHHWAVEKEGQQVALWLNKLGYHAVVLTYPLQQSLAIDQITVHFSHIIDTVKEHLIKDGGLYQQLGIIGFSAGAHLSALAANLLPHFFDFSILCYPVVSFCESFTHQGSLKNLLGESASEERKIFFSTDKQVTKKTGPTFLWHTATDQSVPVANSLSYAQALAKHKVLFECHIFPEGPHGLGLSLDLEIGKKWTKLAADWLKYITNQRK